MPKKLSKKEALFVEAISRGAKKGEAAIAAGYAPSSAHVSASRLLNRPHVLTAIREAAERAINAGVATAALVLLELAESGKTDDVRLRAACALLDRGGMPLIRQSEHRVTVNDQRSDAELLAHIRSLASQLGIASPVQIIEGEIVPTSLPPPAEPDND